MSGLMSKIEAVNAVIAVAGDAPVTSLSGDYEQAVIAEAILDKLGREVQSQSWWFNEVNGLEIVPSTIDEIDLPANTISAEAVGDYGLIVQRGLRMFHRGNNTYKFTDPVCIDLVELLAWDETPQTFRQYVVTLAKEEYNNEYFGSQDVARTVERQLSIAFATFRKEDLKSKDLNIFRNARVHNIAFRNRRI